MKKNKFPKGWDEGKIKKILAHYEKQTEKQALDEDEAAYKDKTQSIIEVPVQLIPTIRQLIAKYQVLRHFKTAR
jgi:hypothetical protein